MGGVSIEVFLEILVMQHKKKNPDVFIFPLLTDMCYKIIASIKLDDWHCNSFHSADSYNNCINYSRK